MPTDTATSAGRETTRCRAGGSASGCPTAADVYLFGDFNSWQRTQLRLDKDRNGVWSIFLPDAMYAGRLVHGSLYKIHVHGANGWHDRIPAWARRVVQDEATKNFTAQFWAPEPYVWRDGGYRPADEPLLIYEAHTGMAQERQGVGTYREFSDRILPLIKEEGYTPYSSWPWPNTPITARSATTYRVCSHPRRASARPRSLKRSSTVRTRSD